MLQGIYPLTKGWNSKIPEVSYQKCKYYVLFFYHKGLKNFLEFFWVKLIWVPKQHFWDTLVDQTEPLCLLRKT